LPIGVFGEREYEDLQLVIDDIARSAVEAMGGDRVEPVEVDAELDGTRIVGSLQPVFPYGLVDFQYSKVAPKHALKLWLRHLLLNWVRGPHRATLIGRSDEGKADTVVYRPVKEPAELLRPLLRLYWEGRLFPLPLFPRTSCAYMDKLLVGRGEADALQAARKAHTVGRGCDGDDVYVRQIYASTDLWQQSREGCVSFAEAAQAVFTPLLEHRQVAA
jgi:exodeoxyribonuclease V gamma subunit